ncbi:MAG: hypothetical protein V3T08_09865 [Gemmatimonadota bacterium]
MAAKPPAPTKDQVALRDLAKVVRGLNAMMEELHIDHYEATLRVVKTKPGYPMVRYELRRRIT